MVIGKRLVERKAERLKQARTGGFSGDASIVKHDKSISGQMKKEECMTKKCCDYEGTCKK